MIEWLRDNPAAAVPLVLSVLCVVIFFGDLAWGWLDDPPKKELS